MANFSAVIVLFRFYIGIIILFLSLAGKSSQAKSKRQIYREQVLPSSGGKIPEGAFRTDRLALNRLNKEGISIPDGVLLEHRHVHNHPHYNRHDPEDEDSLVKIIQSPEDRFVPPEGAYHLDRPRTVSSTYIIRKPISREETFIRTPSEQMPLHEILARKQMNQGHQPYPNTYSQPPEWIPPKYEPPRIPPKYNQEEDLTLAHHPPNRQTERWPPAVSYQHHSVAYYPIPVPFEIPNKETLKEEYYVKDQRESNHGYRDSEDIHSVINWPYLLQRYTQLADEINGLTTHDSYKYSAPHSVFFTPEVVDDADSYYYPSNDRFVRKSKENYLNRESESKSRKRFVKLKCTNGSENTVEDSSPKCQLRY